MIPSAPSGRLLVLDLPEFCLGHVWISFAAVCLLLCQQKVITLSCHRLAAKFQSRQEYQNTANCTLTRSMQMPQYQQQSQQHLML